MGRSSFRSSGRSRRADNGGIIYLIKEMNGADNTYNTGPEMQVLDNDGMPTASPPRTAPALSMTS